MFGFGRTNKPDRGPREEALKRENTLLRQEIQKFQKETAVLREELRRLESIIQEYRDMLFKKKALTPKKDDRHDRHTPKKPGAPLGHPGTTRQIPDRVDEHKDVHLDICPVCSSDKITPCQKYSDHYQEDIVIPQTFVTRFRHHYYWCPRCKETVHGTGDGELPGSYIGPNAKSLASFLHYQMAVPYRKIKILFKEMFTMDFDPTSCVGFDQQIRVRGNFLYDKLKDALKDRPYLHIDETGWRDRWLWCYIAKNHALYKIEPGRGQKELQGTLGDSYQGVLISDFLGAYNGIKSVKQRCLVHALRLIKKWRIYHAGDQKMARYFAKLTTAVKRVIRLNNQINRKRPPDNFPVKKADAIGQLRRLLNEKLEPVKADKFRRKLLDHFDELVACLEYKGIASHNNLAERCLRGNVIMRKITFGNRSEKGERNHEVIMSLIQTARLQNINPLPFLHTILTDSRKAAAVIA